MDGALFGMLYSSIFSVLDVVFAEAIEQTVENIAPITRNAMILYIMVMGVLMIFGRVELKTGDFIKQMGLLIFVYVCSVNAVFYSENISNRVQELPGALLSVTGLTIETTFADSIENSQYDSALLASGYTPNGTAKTLDVISSTFNSIVNGAFAAAGWKDKIGIVIMGVVMSLAMILFLGVSFFLVVLGTLAVKVLLLLGPIYFICLLFQSTKGYFSSWVNQLLNYTLTVVLALFITMVISKVFMTLLSGYADSEWGFGIFTGVVVIALIGFMLLMQVQTMAASLAGGFALSTRVYLPQRPGKRNSFPVAKDTPADPNTIKRK